jgi:hypothetical protein
MDSHLLAVFPFDCCCMNRSENLQIALDRNAARREALPQRARAVLDVGGEMLKGVRRLHEASALLVGSAGMGQVAQLQKALVARRCR